MNFKQIFIIALFICLKDARPDSLLVATDARIARLHLRMTDAETQTQTETQAETETLHDQPASTVRSRHDASTQELYFVTNDTVYYSYYGSYAGARSNAVALGGLSSSDSTIRRVAVDWASPRLYLSRGRSLVAATMMGGQAEHEIQFDHKVDDMAVDPYQRLMFVSAGGQVYSYALGSYDSAVRLDSVTSTMMTSEGDVVGGDVTRLALAVDHHRRRLYALATLADGTSRLLGSNYDGTDAQLVYEGVELEGARALDQQGGQLAWARCLESTQGCQLYLCAPDASARCTHDDVTLVWETSEVINDVIFGSAKRHSPPAEFACRELRCSHSCDTSDPYAVQCSCPTALEIDTRTNTCRESVSPLSAWLSRSHAWLRSEAGRLAESGLILLAASGVALAVSLLCVCLCLALGAGRHGHVEKEWHGLRNRDTRRRQSHTELIL